MATETSFPKTPQAVKLSNFAKSTQPDSISKVRVIVRVRPFLQYETQRVLIVDQEFESNQEEEEVTVHLKDQHTSRNECYKLDAFFGQEDKNVHEIFTREVRPLIPGIFDGYNATVFAYGATGSGKTYTMQGTNEMPGLMPLAMSRVLSESKNRNSTIEISYYEVYMDRCYDLLEPKTNEITVLDDKNGQIHLKGLSGMVVKSMSEFHETLSLGIQRRKVAHTGLNDVSSRSHGVLVVSVSTPRNDGSGSAVSGKLNLIDLAGNEDNRRTLNEGIRLQESAKINQSLFALSNVVYALNNNMPRVPYRESKLTRILQDSLRGNSRALMVACLNPGEYQESVHTVSLAARSRHISNFVSSSQKQATPQVRVDMEEKLRAWLESKGKSKKTHKMAAAFGSPFFIKTPSSTNPMKKLNMCHSSAKSKPMTNQATNFEYESSPIREKFKAFEISPRKVLSPVNSNVERTCHVEQEMCSSLFEANTPKTHFAVPSDDFEFQTPLDRFNALSNNLKTSLAQEYIDFLNIASQEELMEIKGIGLKLADYIVELRETSPLRSLNDLKKLGLSTKQVHNMFSRAAKGIFS